MAVVDDAAHPLEDRSRRRLGSSRPGVWDPDDRSGRALLPARRLHPGQERRRPASRQGRGAQAAVLGGSRALRRVPAARRPHGFFGIVPPIPTQSTFTYYGDVQNVASGMIPRIYNHSYTISADLEIPTGGAEGVIVAEADHLGGFSLFVQDGKLKHTYSFLGVLEFRAGIRHAAADRERQRADGVRRRRAQAGHRRRGDPLRQRRAGRQRPHGAHRSRPLHRLRRHGHRPRQRPAVDRSYATSHRSRSPAQSRRSSSTSTHTSTTQHEQDLHEHAQQTLAGHAINA